MSQEEWKEFLRKQPLVYRRIFILLRDGRTHEQIAEELGLHRRTVDRVVLRYAPEVSS
jgi:DNA-binding NarL/FixJ family response regulator